MRILLLCKRRYTNMDLLADRFGRLFHLPLQLARHGFDVEVVALDYRSTAREEMRAEGVRFRTEPADIAHLPLLYPRLRKLVREARPDVIIASGDSHIGYLGLRLARGAGARSAFDVYDYYPAFKGNRLPGMRWMFRKAVAGADLVIAAGGRLACELQPLNPCIAVIGNGVDTALFRPIERETARRELGLDPAIPIAGYFGSINPTRGPLLIEAAALLRARGIDLHLLLAGPVRGIPLEREWIDYRGQVAQSAIPALINACDVAVIPYLSSPFNDRSSACKIAEYLACGVPVVATDVAGHADYFGDTENALCAPTPQAMADTIARQIERPSHATLPPGMSWEGLGTTLANALNGPIVEQK